MKKLFFFYGWKKILWIDFLWETTKYYLIYFSFVQALSVSFLFERLSNRIWLNARASRIVCVMTSNRISRVIDTFQLVFSIFFYFLCCFVIKSFAGIAFQAKSFFSSSRFLYEEKKNAMCLRSTDLPPDMMNCVLMVIALELIFSSLKRHESLRLKVETSSRQRIILPLFFRLFAVAVVSLCVIVCLKICWLPHYAKYVKSSERAHEVQWGKRAAIIQSASAKWFFAAVASFASNQL